MRDAGLQQAIQAAGGISALAKLLHVAQPSISIWSRVPAERVLAVEAVTSVARSVLRPDLYPDEAGVEPSIDAVDEARARLYLLLGNLILNVPDEDSLIALHQVEGDESALGQALTALSEAADVRRIEAVTREHFNLFVGVGRGELLPFSSYYLTGFLYERPLVRMRQDLRRLGLERDASHHEPEDHIGFILEVMAGIVARRFAAEPGEEKRFFLRHIQPWAATFFADLEKAESADFYKPVARLGAEFIRIEREAFALDEEEMDLTDQVEIAQGTVSEGARA
jgi:TorA maturation chaperone TorD/DNA-binding transcriptional regulator YdaS (Cro superfamily)